MKKNKNITPVDIILDAIGCQVCLGMFAWFWYHFIRIGDNDKFLRVLLVIALFGGVFFGVRCLYYIIKRG